MPAAADANAPVTPLQHQSVFADYVKAEEVPQSPDKVWIRANRAVLGEETEASAPGGQPTPGTSEKTARPESMHGKHEPKGAHQ